MKLVTLIMAISINLFLNQVNAQQSEFYGFSVNSIFKTDSNGNNLQIIYNIPSSFEGSFPSSSLCSADNGMFYGITQGGGLNGEGVLFEWDPASNSYLKKLDLNSAQSGHGQFGSLVQVENGKLFGMTSSGGLSDMGVLFEWDLVSNSIVKKLDLDSIKGGSPEGTLIMSDNGKIYGMMTYGGIYNHGVIFEWDPAIDMYTKKIDFNGTDNGRHPKGGLCLAENGRLIGMTMYGGENDEGVLFEWDPVSNNFIKKFDFKKEIGNPIGTLIKANNGKFYGVTFGGGINDRGVLFEWDSERDTLIEKFDFELSGIGYPCYSLVQATNGKLYGMTHSGRYNESGALFEWDVNDSEFSLKYEFIGFRNGMFPNGRNPFGSLSLASDGHLYGVTYGGGVRDCGTIFRWDIEKDTLIKKIDFFKADKGLNIVGVPVEIDDGKLYGMTRFGGEYNAGVIFEWDPINYTYTRKHSFNGKDGGKEPLGSLVKANNGRLYGMTNSGGIDDNGVLFEWDPSTNTFKKKIDFINRYSGGKPRGSLIQGANDKLYGLTSEGGMNGDGVLFEWDPVKNTYGKKMDFKSADYGRYPFASLLQADNGKLYGTTEQGGIFQYGVVFEWDNTTSTFIKKIDFNGVENGSHPFSSLIKADNGRLYGTTVSGGLYGDGTLFEWDPDTNTFRKKFDFNSLENGLSPRGSLMQASNGKIYGIISLTRWDDSGSLFEWDPVTGIFLRKPDNIEEKVHFQDGLVEIFYPHYKKIKIEACQSYVSPSKKYTWYASGDYYDTIPNAGGHQCIIHINLTIKKSTTSSISATTLDRYISPSGKIWTSSGEYKDTIINAAGCDSIITVHLTIISTYQSARHEFYGVSTEGGEFNAGTIFKTDGNGNNLRVLYNFPVKNIGINPIGNLIASQNGKYYGVTIHGGVNDMGVIYEYDSDSNKYEAKFEFTHVDNGEEPSGSLMLANNGKLYGLTRYGGSSGSGVLFEWDPFFNAYTKLFEFTSSGRNPIGSLIQANNGKLYGVTSYGGLYGKGVIFEYDPITKMYNNKFDFGDCFCENEGKTTGNDPSGTMVKDSNGKLYGMTASGGEYGGGVLFMWDTDSNSFSKKYDFTYENGNQPIGSLIVANNGNLYGVTRRGGNSGYGVLFEWNPLTNIYTKKIDFNGVDKGSFPSGYLIQAKNGKIYGVTTSGGSQYQGVVFEWDPLSDTFKKKMDFKGEVNEVKPCCLTECHNNSLIGVTSQGGSNNCGELFEFDIATDTYSKKIDFNLCENGRLPSGKLVQASNEILYGTTYYGGKYGYGVLFEWNLLNHTFTKKVDFNIKDTLGYPRGSLKIEDNGKLIGLTDNVVNNTGEIFEWDPNTNMLSNLYEFSSIEEGLYPTGSLLKAKNGKFYGLTRQGGEYNMGVLFEWDPIANTYSKKINFNGSERGSNPSCNLIQADDGKLYGVTVGGGVQHQGTIFEWNPVTNVFKKKLDLFIGSDCRFASASIFQAFDGKFYGTTCCIGIDADYNSVFEWDTTAHTLIKKFAGTNFYLSGLLQADNNKIYGLSGPDNGRILQWDPATNKLTTKYAFNGRDGRNPSPLLETKYRLFGLSNVESCNSYISPSGKYIWTNSGVYRDTIPSFEGYDSIIKVTLHITSVDTSISQNNPVLSSNASNATYQWINCDNENTLLEGETRQSFTATADGNYAVIILQNGCIDTSACIAVNITGLIVNTFKHNLTISPNPTRGVFTIDLGDIYSRVDITVTQMDGRILNKDKIIYGRYKDLQITAPPGTYMVIVTSNNERAVFKILKK